MTTRNIAIITAALFSAIAFSAPASAEPSLGTGGYATELHKMGMMKMLDANADHMVTNQEFSDYYGQIFDALDTNHDGSLDSKEWTGTKGKTEVNLTTGGYSRELHKIAVMKAMDTDGDHKVTKDEFVKFHEAIFTAMDKNSDKQLDPQEWAAKTLGS